MFINEYLSYSAFGCPLLCFYGRVCSNEFAFKYKIYGEVVINDVFVNPNHHGSSSYLFRTAWYFSVIFLGVIAKRFTLTFPLRPSARDESETAHSIRHDYIGIYACW